MIQCRAQFLWRRTYIKHIKCMTFLGYTLSWRRYSRCVQGSVDTVTVVLDMCNQCNLYFVTRCSHYIKCNCYTGIWTRPLLFKSINIIAICMCSGGLFQILVPSYRNALIHTPLVPHICVSENIKAPCHWPLCREFTGDKWPVTRKMFPFDDVIMAHMIDLDMRTCFSENCIKHFSCNGLHTGHIYRWLIWCLMPSFGFYFHFIYRLTGTDVPNHGIIH